MIIRDQSPNLTPKERAELDWEKESTRMQVDLTEKIKQMDIELEKTKNRWTQLWRLPLAIVKLPVAFVVAFAVPISLITGKDLPKDIWEWLK